MQVVNLAVQITRFVDDHQPGWVDCEFRDAHGRRHIFTEKVPILTTEDLRPDSAYPKSGCMPCELLHCWRDASGRELARISTANPLDDESTDGLSEFIVEAIQLSP